MKKILLVAAIAMSVGLMSSVASAATVIFTEGNRAQVAGSTVLNPVDAPGSLPGYNMGVIGVNEPVDTIELHGRARSHIDNYEFTATSSFVVELIFGGFDLENSGSTTESGFIIESSGLNSSDLTLTNSSNGGSSSTITLLTNISSGTSLLFSGTAGAHILSLEALGNPVLYDIRISAVPLPAALPLMGAGMALMGFIGWRRKKAASA